MLRFIQGVAILTLALAAGTAGAWSIAGAHTQISHRNGNEPLFAGQARFEPSGPRLVGGPAF